MSDPVPAIREADATGAVAAIFADIRAVFGVGVVNLIWRHLAVFPGGLEWAWGSLRPLYAQGHMPAAAARLRARLALPRLPEIPRKHCRRRACRPRPSGQSTPFLPPMTAPTPWRWWR
jgi:hypothetical protein